MFRNRLILVIGTLSLLLVGMASSYSRLHVATVTAQGASDFHQRHPDWTWAVNDQKASIPLTGDSAFPDYSQRHPEQTASFLLGQDASDYFQRHPELIAPAEASLDTMDYYFRHLELQGSSIQNGDLTDYFFRHPGN